tara:strand:- start:796 stop:1296 length:501 start_codon:yes stop_codon:yes gene_type:complete
MKILTKNITEKDLKVGLKIYNYFIINSFSNFEEKKLTYKKFIGLYKKIKSNKLPFILAKKNKDIIGIAFVNKFREKSGYRFTFEHSIYVNNEYSNLGYGTLILKELLKLCKKNKNIRNLIAVIGGSDNNASIRIHKKNGFKLIGTLKKIGFKKNKWIDSVYMQRKI